MKKKQYQKKAKINLEQLFSQPNGYRNRNLKWRPRFKSCIRLFIIHANTLKKEKLFQYPNDGLIVGQIMFFNIGSANSLAIL